MHSSIEFSAQFGGRDAANAMLPYFRALKTESKKHKLKMFPFKVIAYILRVDGEVNSYGLSGPGHIEIEGYEYVSVDIGVLRDDYMENPTSLVDKLLESIKGSAEILRHGADARLKEIDFDELGIVLEEFCDSFRRHVMCSSSDLI